MDGWMDSALKTRIYKFLCSKACTVELHFSAISFDSDLSKNTLKKSRGMDGMDDETRTDKDDKISCVSCITGAMNELKALLAVAMMVSGEPTC